MSTFGCSLEHSAMNPSSCCVLQWIGTNRGDNVLSHYDLQKLGEQEQNQIKNDIYVIIIHTEIAPKLALAVDVHSQNARAAHIVFTRHDQFRNRQPHLR